MRKSLLFLLFAACGSGSRPPPTCTPTSDAGNPQPDLATFVPATHPALADVVSHGGHVCVHPQIVTITYEEDPHAAEFESFAQFVATSSWLTTVGAEYGVSAATSVAYLRLPGPVPSTITDDELKHDIAGQIDAGALPEPGSDPNDFIYMFYFPASTTVLDAVGSPLCPWAGSYVSGYHDEYADLARHFSYAAILACSSSQTAADYEGTASHELIEAATDPYPTRDPAYVLSDYTTGAWYGELADLCLGKTVTWCGHRLTRVWSNAAALGGGPPCAPASVGEAYFSTATPTSTVQRAVPGGTLTIPVVGFSNQPVADWFVYATPYPTLSTFTPHVSLDTAISNNGRMATVTITVPAGAPHGAFATVYLVSSATRTSLSEGDYNFWPIGLLVP